MLVNEEATYRELKLIFDEMRIHGVQPQRNQFETMARVASENRDPKMCETYLTEMAKAGFQVREQDRAWLAMCTGTEAEQLHARRRFFKDRVRIKKVERIKRMAKLAGAQEDKFRMPGHTKGRFHKI